MTDEDLIRKSHRFINRFILKSKQFCDKYCFPDGLHDILMIYSRTGTVFDENKYSNKLGYDYDYFAFVKSTKTLIALKSLLNNAVYFFNEDCFMLIRSIFENHIINRYVRERIDIEGERKQVVEKFIINPLAVTVNYFSLNGLSILDNNGVIIGKIPNPSGYKMGEEKNYYSYFYQFLCQYTHCSFGALSCYFNDNFYTYRKNNFQLITLLFTIFVFTKIYEGVVTVEGENFDSENEENNYYDLGYDSLEFQLIFFDYLIDYYSNNNKERIAYIIEKYIGNGEHDSTNVKIIDMLILMKKSIFDNDIGSIDKSKMKDATHFMRKYPKLGFFE